MFLLDLLSRNINNILQCITGFICVYIFFAPIQRTIPYFSIRFLHVQEYIENIDIRIDILIEGVLFSFSPRCVPLIGSDFTPTWMYLPIDVADQYLFSFLDGNQSSYRKSGIVSSNYHCIWRTAMIQTRFNWIHPIPINRKPRFLFCTF